jgi:membrane-associated phospholipid phosphatase
MPRIIELPPEKGKGEAARVTWQRVLLGAGAVVLLLLAFLIDGLVDRWAATHRDPGWFAAARMCSRYFAWHWLMAAALMAWLVALLRKNREWIRVVCVMMIAASLAGLSADLLRGITGRTRPYYKEVPQGFYGVRHDSKWLVTKHAFNSFPSGHAAAMTAFAVPLWLWRRRLALLVIATIAAVAASRIYLAAHHLSDVVAGAILGSTIAIWIWRRASGDWELRGWRLQRVRA